MIDAGAAGRVEGARGGALKAKGEEVVAGATEGVVPNENVGAVVVVEGADGANNDGIEV